MPKVTPLRIAFLLLVVWGVLPLFGVAISESRGQMQFATWWLLGMMLVCGFILHDVITPRHDYKEKSEPPRDEMM